MILTRHKMAQLRFGTSLVAFKIISTNQLTISVWRFVHIKKQIYSTALNKLTSIVALF